ncbi:MAG: recombinase RecA, partial [Aeromonas sobria]
LFAENKTMAAEIEVRLRELLLSGAVPAEKPVVADEELEDESEQEFE